MTLTSHAFYDAMAPWYTAYCEQPLLQKSTKKEVTLLGSFKPKSILEFGIGTGRFAKMYLELYPNTHYVGVDSSKEMLVRAQDTQAQLIHISIENYLEYALAHNTFFDCIIAPYTALHHIKTHQQLRLIRKMQRVSNLILLNILTKQQENLLCNNKEKNTVTFLTPRNELLSTDVYPIDKKVRTAGEVIYGDGERELIKISK